VTFSLVLPVVDEAHVCAILVNIGFSCVCNRRREERKKKPLQLIASRWHYLTLRPRAGDFLAGDFLAGDFLAGDFLAGDYVL
jgi:hypothetical protein